MLPALLTGACQAASLARNCHSPADSRAIGLSFLQEEDKLLVRKREFKDKSKQRKAYATHGLVR